MQKKFNENYNGSDSNVKTIFLLKFGKPLGTIPKAKFKKGLGMQEVLTAVTYLVVWLICEKVLSIESGLAKLLISLTAAIAVYVVLAVKDHMEKKEDK